MKQKWFWVGAALLVLAIVYLPRVGIGAGQVLVFLLVLLCPLLHLLGGHRHGAPGGGDTTEGQPSAPRSGEVRASNREDA